MSEHDYMLPSRPKEGFLPPYRIEVGTDDIAVRARELFPNAEVTVNPARGSSGWVAYSKKVDDAG